MPIRIRTFPVPYMASAMTASSEAVGKAVSLVTHPQPYGNLSFRSQITAEIQLEFLEASCRFNVFDVFPDPPKILHLVGCKFAANYRPLPNVFDVHSSAGAFLSSLHYCSPFAEPRFPTEGAAVASDHCGAFHNLKSCPRPNRAGMPGSTIS